MKKIILAILLLFLAMPAPANEMIDDCLDMANNFFNTGDLEQAREYVNIILRQYPDHYGANYLMLKLTPPDGYLENKNESSQIIIRPRDTKTGNAKSDEYNTKGQKFYSKKNYDKARACFEYAIEVNPKNQYAFNNLGLTYQKQREYKKAEKAFNKAIALDKNFTIAYDNLAQMYIQQSEYPKAKKYLSKVIAVNNQDYCAKFLLGLIYKNESQYKKAIEMFNDVEQISPNFALNYMYLADVYYQMKDYYWSNTTIQKYIALCPKDDWGYYVLYRNYLLTKDLDVAKTYLVKAMRLNNCIDYRIYLADLESMLDNTQGTIDALRSIPDKNGEIFNELGLNHLKLQEYEKALEYFQCASASKNARLIYFYNVALVYKDLNDTENYNKIMKAIQSTTPMLYIDYIDLSAIYLDCTGKNDALNIINRGIYRFPKVRALYEQKLKIYTLTNDRAGIESTEAQIKKIFRDKGK